MILPAICLTGLPPTSGPSMWGRPIASRKHAIVVGYGASGWRCVQNLDPDKWRVTVVAPPQAGLATRLTPWRPRLPSLGGTTHLNERQHVLSNKAHDPSFIWGAGHTYVPGQVSKVCLERRSVTVVDESDGGAEQEISGDCLVLAQGQGPAVSSDMIGSGLSNVAPLESQQDANHIQSLLARTFNRAAVNNNNNCSSSPSSSSSSLLPADAADRLRRRTICVLGGGLNGMRAAYELALSINELNEWTGGDFAASGARVALVQPGPLLPGFDAAQRHEATRQLLLQGVELHCGRLTVSQKRQKGSRRVVKSERLLLLLLLLL